MKKFSQRDDNKEILDNLEIEGEAVSQNLKELDIINTLLGGNAISVVALKTVLKFNPAKKHWKIADLGCGSGHLMLEMHKVLKQKSCTAEFTGFDANSFIVKYAQAHCVNDPSIRILCQNVLTNPFPEVYDIIHASLFLHHFTTDELVLLLAKLKQHTATALIINDLHRHRLAYYAIKWLTGLFSKSYLVKNDAALSVAKGFKKAEWTTILKRAGYKRYTIKWVWAFRHQIILYPDSLR
ncbi:MAG: methyltransferase domain-containing protein [Cytophagaceae bacterium]|nr:methyltransferase domain-containing protein [Cytophagaceae bacterium]